jgi:plastocyanin
LNNLRIIFIVISILILNLTLGFYAFAEPPDYTLSLDPPITSLYQGENITFEIILSSLRNFDSQVSIRAEEIPEGVTVDFENNVTRLTETENISITANVKVNTDAPAGLHEIIIEANGAGLIHKISKQLDIIGVGNIIVIIKDFWYFPDNLTIRKGSDVTWINQDLTGHTATADDGEFDTDLLRQNMQSTIKFDNTGKYPYFCIPHPQMVASVKVVD